MGLEVLQPWAQVSKEGSEHWNLLVRTAVLRQHQH